MNAASKPASSVDYDVVIIGAGCCGLHALHHMRENGLRVRLFEAGSGVGGTWYWNRYPGARVDIESMEYSYAFSDVVQQEWNWSERYAAQPELLRYFNFVADRLDLRRDMQFNTRIESTVFDEATERWVLRTASGDVVNATFCLMTTGLLSAPNKPKFKGLESFKGKTYHTGQWPHEGVDFTGQRVGVIGTGSSAVQSIPFIAKQAAHLHVFQRTPAYCVPLRNHPMPEEYQREVKADYAEWRRKERYESFGGWVAVNYKPIDLMTQSALEVTPEERLAVYEDRWKNGGLAFYNIYPDVYSNKQANDTLADFVRGKIRERIKDPKIADLMMPTFPILTKRLIADNNYYETYERENVTLVDVRTTPIDGITANGVRVGEKDYEFDSIVFATGFDALTGALTRMDIRGRNGETLKDHWEGGVRTQFGMMSAGFPNLFIIAAAGSPVPLFHPMLLCEDQLSWITGCIEFLQERKILSIEATAEAEDQWGGLCEETVSRTLFPLTKSWYNGGNVPGKSRSGLAYFGGMKNYRKMCGDAAASGYAEFRLTKTPAMRQSA
jgi:cyclohexanone monooxygenase